MTLLSTVIVDLLSYPLWAVMALHLLAMGFAGFATAELLAGRSFKQSLGSLALAVWEATHFLYVLLAHHAAWTYSGDWRWDYIRFMTAPGYEHLIPQPEYMAILAVWLVLVALPVLATVLVMRTRKTETAPSTQEQSVVPAPPVVPGSVQRGMEPEISFNSVMQGLLNSYSYKLQPGYVWKVIPAISNWSKNRQLASLSQTVAQAKLLAADLTEIQKLSDEHEMRGAMKQREAELEQMQAETSRVLAEAVARILEATRVSPEDKIKEIEAGVKSATQADSIQAQKAEAAKKAAVAHAEQMAEVAVQQKKQKMAEEL